MNRRRFLSTLIGGVAAEAAVRTWPFRVYSFPTEVSVPPPLLFASRTFTIDGVGEIAKDDYLIVTTMEYDQLMAQQYFRFSFHLPHAHPREWILKDGTIG